LERRAAHICWQRNPPITKLTPQRKSKFKTIIPIRFALALFCSQWSQLFGGEDFFGGGGGSCPLAQVSLRQNSSYFVGQNLFSETDSEATRREKFNVIKLRKRQLLKNRICEPLLSVLFCI